MIYRNWLTEGGILSIRDIDTIGEHVLSSPQTLVRYKGYCDSVPFRRLATYAISMKTYFMLGLSHRWFWHQMDEHSNDGWLITEDKKSILRVMNMQHLNHLFRK